MMDGLGMINAQGNYRAGRGADGLEIRTPSRHGAGVPESGRPSRISGKPRPPPTLDPALISWGRGTLPPTWRIPWGRGTRIELTDPRFRGKVLRRPRPPRPIKYGWRMGMPIRKRRVNKAKTIRHRQAFINWVKNWAPGLYVRAKKKADLVEATEGTLGQLGGWWDTFQESITDLGGKYLQFRTQKEILEAQLERMRAGLPPLQTSEYAPTIAIKPDPGTTREITGAIGAGLGRMLPFIAIGGVALLVMMRRR